MKKIRETIMVKNYIGEDNKALDRIFDKAISGSRVLVKAETGSGKTYSMMKMMEQLKEEFIFVVPQVSLIQQIECDDNYDIECYYGDKKVNSVLEERICAMTWNKFSYLKSDVLKNKIVVLDEYHQLINDTTYRNEAIRGVANNIKYAKGVIYLTGTPDMLDNNEFDYIVEYNIANRKKSKITVFENINDKEIINKIDRMSSSSKVVILMNDIDRLKLYQSQIRQDKKSEILFSENSWSSEVYDSILKNQTLGDCDILFTTSFICAGVNILDENVKIFIINETSVPTIVQFKSRFRKLDKVDVNLFINSRYANEVAKYDCEKQIEELVDMTNDICKCHNKKEKIVASTFISKSKESADKHMFRNPITKKWEVDSFVIRQDVYSAYYKYCSIEDYKRELEKYFDDVMFDIVESDIMSSKEIREKKRTMIKKLSNVKDSIVGLKDIYRNDISDRLLLFYYDYEVANDENRKDLIDKTFDILKDIDMSFILSDNEILSVLKLYDTYVIEDGLSTDVAWKLANIEMCPNKKLWNNAIDFMVYKEVRKENNEYDKGSIDMMVLDRFLELMPIGSKYREADLRKIAVELSNIDITFTYRKVQNLIGMIYETKRTSKRIDGKSVNYNLVVDFINIDYLNKKLKLGLTSNEIKEVNDYVYGQVNKEIKRIEYTL